MQFKAFLVGLVAALEAPEASQQRLDADGCVRVAIESSALVEAAEANVHALRARLAEIESVYYPKLSALAFLAPMFTVHQLQGEQQYRVHWQHLGDWGPYTNLEMLLVQPLFSFGRAEAGSRAARERILVEAARLREARSAVALEARKFYYAHLFAASMKPTLEQAIKLLQTAQERAQASYDAGEGEVTAVDLAKLTYGTAEAQRFLLVANDGALLAAAALRHTMAVSLEAPLTLADSAMPPIPEDDIQSLAWLLQDAAQTRPEWAQVDHGGKAALAWEQAERMANLPVLFAAGQFRAAWTPTRSRDTYPWHFDNYNVLMGGVALGLKFDLDPALSSARGEVALAKREEVEALRRFAATGIPLQVRKAHDDVARARRAAKLTSEALAATRQWMTSAAGAYQSGTGEARDLLEGLGAYVQARRAHLETLQAYHVGVAELLHATGHTLPAT